MEKIEYRAFILPCNFPMVLIIFAGRGGAEKEFLRAHRKAGKSKVVQKVLGDLKNDFQRQAVPGQKEVGVG